MKKSLKYFVILVALLLVSTGCNNKDPKTKFIDALNKTDEVTSIKEKVNIEASMKEEGQTVSGNVEVELDVYTESENNGTIYGKFKASTTGISYSTEAYIDVKENNIGLYLNLLGQWMKFEEKIEDADKYNEELNKYLEEHSELKMDDIEKYIKEVKEEKTDKKGYTKLTVVYDKNKINDSVKNLMAEAKSEMEKVNTEMENDSPIDYDKEEIDEYFAMINDTVNKGVFSKDIHMTVYLKDDYIATIEVDFAEIMDDIVRSMMTEEEIKEYESAELKLKLTFEFSDYNKVGKIEIPEEAKNGSNIMDLLVGENSMLDSYSELF